VLASQGLNTHTASDRMTSRQLFFGLSFFLLGSVFLLLNRMLAEEGLRLHDALPWLPGRIPMGPLAGRIFIIGGGLASMILGVLLLTRVIN
jgi:hypothetical protein